MSPGFPEAPLRDTLPMCHSPLRHGLRQATHNTLGLCVACLIPCWRGEWHMGTVSLTEPLGNQVTSQSM
jgi:hypothetical protein